MKYKIYNRLISIMLVFSLVYSIMLSCSAWAQRYALAPPGAKEIDGTIEVGAKKDKGIISSSKELKSEEPRMGSFGRYIQKIYGVNYTPFSHAPIFEELVKVGIPCLFYLILSHYKPNIPIVNSIALIILLGLFG